MNNGKIAPVRTIKKLYVKTTVEFAINNIPNVDQDTPREVLGTGQCHGEFWPHQRG